MPEAPCFASHVGERLRERREALGLSRKEVAGRLGVSTAEFRLFEQGAKKMPPRRLIQAAETLQTSLGYFLEDAPDVSTRDALSRTSAELVRFLAMPESYALVSAFIRIPCPKRRQAVVEFLRTQVAAEPERSTP